MFSKVSLHKDMFLPIFKGSSPREMFLPFSSSHVALTAHTDTEHTFLCELPVQTTRGLTRNKPRKRVTESGEDEGDRVTKILLPVPECYGLCLDIPYLVVIGGAFGGA